MKRPSTGGRTRPRIGLLFDYDWDQLGFGRLAGQFRFDRAGFDLFSFPSNARLVGFDLERFADRQALRGRRRGWSGVVSHHEQFGALAAALVAERLGLPGTPVQAVLACQHKLHARAVLDLVAPEANLDWAPLEAEYGGPIPPGLRYPRYVKPVKAAFSVLARRVDSEAELHAHTRFGRRELWVIRRLVEPFERVVRQRLPAAGTAHRMLLEEPMSAPQFNLDGWVYDGRAHALGVVDAVMYPGTQAFMRWDHPSRLPAAVQARALDVAQRFLSAVGYTQGCFNMEFFYDDATDRLAVIEFNPRLASQFSDLYRRVRGLDPHAISLALALGRDPLQASGGAADVQVGVPVEVPVEVPVDGPAQGRAGAASSLVYRSFSAGQTPPLPSPARQAALKRQFPDALLYTFPKAGHALERDFKWLGSHRYGILHLQGRDALQLRERAEAASALLGWPAPFAGEVRGAQPLASPTPGPQAPGTVSVQLAPEVCP